MDAERCRRTLAEQRAQLVDLRFKVRQGQLQQVRQLRQVRATIARLHTHLATQSASADVDVTVTAA